MSFYVEIIIYIAIIIGILILSLTFFDRDKTSYIRTSEEDTNIKVILCTKGIKSDDIKSIKWIIEKGKYDNIYDIVNEFIVSKKD